MKKIIPYLIFINCKGKDTSGDQTILPRDENNKENNPDNKDILNQNYIRNKEIIDRINKIYSASTPKRGFTEEEWNEIQELKIEYQKNNQKEIKNHVLPSKELNFNEKKIESIKKEAQTKKIFVGIDKLIPGMPINIFFNLNPLPVEKFTNENEEIIIIQEIKEDIYSFISFISTIENFKKFYNKEITFLEFYQKAKFLDEDGNLCSFIEKDFSKKETDQGYSRIIIDYNLLCNKKEKEKYLEYFEKYIKENENKKFIIHIQSMADHKFNEIIVNFYESFKEKKYKNLYWEGYIYKNNTNTQIIKEKKIKEIYNFGASTKIEHLFSDIFFKEMDILYFKEDYDKLPNQEVKKGKIISVEDFFENLKKNLKKDEKIKLEFYDFEKEKIEESEIYKKYKDYFEVTWL